MNLTQEQDQRLNKAYELVVDLADEVDDDTYDTLLDILHAFEDVMEG